MDFGFSSDELEFQRRVREFVAENMRPELETGISYVAGAGEDDRALAAAQAAFRQRLDRAGLLRVAWPKELGGEGLPPIYEYILRQELERNGLEPRVGMSLTSAVIAECGTEAQKEEFLEKLLNKELQMCAGFSEPRGGSDLAGLETRAVREGNDWVLNGQKIYTTYADCADFMWCLARTDKNVAKHDGISIFMVDMSHPGVTVRPLHTMGSYLTHEVFLDDVRVPNRHLIGGEPNKGWYQNTLALDVERINIGSYFSYKRFFEEVVAFARTDEFGTKAILAEPAMRLRLGELAVDLETLRQLANRNAYLVNENQVSSMVASMAKIWSTEFYYRLTSVVMQLMGPFGQLQKGSKWALLDGEAEVGYRNTPPTRFGGGANEVQRDVVARRGLGLPRSR